MAEPSEPEQSTRAASSSESDVISVADIKLNVNSEVTASNSTKTSDESEQSSLNTELKSTVTKTIENPVENVKETCDSDKSLEESNSNVEGSHKTRRLLLNRKSSSDGAAKVFESVKEKERSRRASECGEKASALKSRINNMYDSLKTEMEAKYKLNKTVVSDFIPGDLHLEALEDTGYASDVTKSTEEMKSRCMSIAEVKELAYHRLQEELHKAQQELKLKDEEVARLSQIRDQVGSELEDLTAALFEEANKMVQTALSKQSNAEKQLAEANMKIDGLAAEVQALKTLVITSTPAMPNRHLHPQLESKAPVNGVRSLFRSGHRRSPSNYELASTNIDSPPGSPTKDAEPAAISNDSHEVDPFYHQEFVQWRQNPILKRETPFLKRIYEEDILPCLQFQNQQLAQRVLQAIEEDSMVIEAVGGKNPFPKKCALLEAPRLCKYKMKLGESKDWNYISQLGRNRIIAVCDFFCYLRYIQNGLVKSGIHEVYWEVIRRRQEMALARLGVLVQ